MQEVGHKLVLHDSTAGERLTNVSVISVTFDTSCCIDLFRGDASPSPPLVSLVRLGLAGRVDIAISDIVREEIAGGQQEPRAKLGLERLNAFPNLAMPAHLQPRILELGQQLMAGLFPNSSERGRTYEHNQRDCRHLATHTFSGRTLFVTLDRRLRKKADLAHSAFQIEIATPEEAVERVTSSEPAIATFHSTPVARAYRAEDEGEVRALLADLKDDYPDFDGWLTKTLRGASRGTISVGIIDGRLAGVAIWKYRDSESRAVKLSAFRVAEPVRNSGLGGHLLFHAVRAWVEAGCTVAYVTMPSSRPELVQFFSRMGFLIQGVSPSRYHDGQGEVVMGKLLLRKRIDESNIGAFVRQDLPSIFGRPPPSTSAVAQDTSWLLPPRVRYPTGRVEPTGAIVLEEDGGEHLVRRMSPFDLETLFYPLRVALPSRRSLLVPIRQEWADRMLDYPGKQPGLFSENEADSLLIRSENVYYCFPRCEAEVVSKPRILFYVGAPVSALVGEAIVVQSSVDYPEVLFGIYGGLGIYEIPQIERHTVPSGPRAGQALAIRFGFYVPFATQVSLLQLRRQMNSARFAPQGLHPIGVSMYEALRSLGGLEW